MGEYYASKQRLNFQESLAELQRSIYIQENFKNDLSNPGNAYHDKLMNHDALKCQTKECFRVSNEILKNLNQKVDPCTDFEEEFSCGGFRRHYLLKNKLFINNAFSALETNSLKTKYRWQRKAWHLLQM
ncbi:unnamed protein product [Lepeophtheirus salmonis]|uniref:(salmon louse) hypothetical protein n=1 Tax=Lepeophtheirus salmonis TaxID=72036 RepID=A0A7R8CKF6_LEPSM|nr:unnamed protein product [Lepeophtheirus salmonis]CAF2803123.1 unnamed protein product [Lepeophtheirus salmonis]